MEQSKNLSACRQCAQDLREQTIVRREAIRLKHTPNPRNIWLLRTNCNFCSSPINHSKLWTRKRWGFRFVLNCDLMRWFPTRIGSWNLRKDERTFDRSSCLKWCKLFAESAGEHYKRDYLCRDQSKDHRSPLEPLIWPLRRPQSCRDWD